MQTGDIKRRIRSVKSTQQITRAMKFVAAAKLRRAQEKMLAMRPYAEAMEAVFRRAVADAAGDEHPFFGARGETRRAAIVLIAADRGLCGGFNANILRTARQFAEGLGRDAEPVYFAVGRRAIGGLRKTRERIEKSYFDIFEKLSYALAGEICGQLVALYSERDPERRIDAAYVVYNEFVSMIAQRPVVRKLLPLDPRAPAPERGSRATTAARPPVEGDGSGGGAQIWEDGIVEESEVEMIPAHSPFIEDREPEETPEEEAKRVEEAKRELARTAVRRSVYELEPDPASALEKLVARRMATQLYRGTIESYAAELSARMSAMDSATGNADKMIDDLTLAFNQARQAGITGELMDIVGGANALD